MNDTLNRYWHQAAAYGPHLLTAVLLAIAAFIVATVARAVTVRALRAARVDERVQRHQPDRQPVTKPVGDIIYYLVLLLFLPGILSALGLGAILAPVQGLVGGILAALPNILAAGLILVIGAFVARILRTLVTNVASTAGLDRVSERLGLGPNARLSNLLGIIVYALVILPVITAALDALNFKTVTQPIRDMLQEMFTALPNIIAAVAVVAVAFFVGRVVAGIVSGVLANVGFDRLAGSMGLSRTTTSVPTDAQGGTKPVTPSNVVGYFVQAFIVLFAVMAALDLLGATQLEGLVRNFVTLIGQILLGLVIFGVGVYLANLLAGLVSRTSVGSSPVMVGVARGATLALFGAMALRQMGIANEIVNLAFGLTLGALAVAFALAFGLGGREAAGKVAEQWRESLQQRKQP